VTGLASVLSAGGELSSMCKLAVVSACNSEHVGYAFVAAGVPHVVAVDAATQVCIVTVVH
jgi:hypothetical protein